MKPLHKITFKDGTRPSMCYVQVKSGEVVNTTPYMILVMAVADVFGDAVTEKDHFYFERAQWGLKKFHTADRYEHKDGILTAYKKNEELARIKTYDQSTFESQVGVFPNWPAVVPPLDSSKDTTHLSIDPTLLKELYDTWGVKPYTSRLTLRGSDRAITIESYEDKGYALLMPVYLKEFIPERLLTKQAAETDEEML